MHENSIQNLKIASTKKKACVHCGDLFVLANAGKHERACSKNILNQKPCPVCNKMFSGKSVTCSYSCSNKHFANVRNKPEKYKNYRTICFANHEKKCIVCGETKIVDVHHLNENRKDNSPDNLVPVCPTHHQYIHSRYKNLVMPIIELYLANKSNRE